MNERRIELNKKVTRQEYDVLLSIFQTPFTNQRMLAESSGYSLGGVNRSIKELMAKGYLSKEVEPTDKAKELLKETAPQRAIILAAGFGMRMVPINIETPKAMLEVKGQCLIERQINQLHEVGIREIYVVVGFMKERFEYLIDKYGVELVVNPDYAVKNNMYSLQLALLRLKKRDKLSNTYILPSDIWNEKNPFHKNELYSWYMISDILDDDSNVRVSRKMELVRNGTGAGNKMIGISYLLSKDLENVLYQIDRLSQTTDFCRLFWEDALYDVKNKMLVEAKIVHGEEVTEINTYEQLRELDRESKQLQSDAISEISKVLNVFSCEIVDISVLKKGMTNRSFLFSCKGKKYIMRIPGEGTDRLINREQEANVYHVIAGKELCDDPVYINPQNGYKITAFLNNVRTCDPFNENDLRCCMEKLKAFHEMKLHVDHEFDIFGQIEFYESLWGGKPSIYADYKKTKENVWSLIPFIERHCKEKVLTHIDANHDNFLFYKKDGVEQLQLTDWEYAGMQDPDVDIAMFCIYAMYNKEQSDHLISIYFKGECNAERKAKIYCYMAACGLLWSNWCEYKNTLGVEFGEYSLCQYRYAKEYFQHAQKEMKKIEEKQV